MDTVVQAFGALEKMIEGAKKGDMDLCNKANEILSPIIDQLISSGDTNALGWLYENCRCSAFAAARAYGRYVELNKELQKRYSLVPRPEQ